MNISKHTKYINIYNLKNYINQDTVLDWFEVYGGANNFKKDEINSDKLFNNFIEKRALNQKINIKEKLENKFNSFTINNNADIHQMIKDTLNSIYEGYDIIFSGVIFSNHYKLISTPDILIKSDKLESFLEINKHTLYNKTIFINKHSKDYKFYKHNYYVINISCSLADLCSNNNNCTLKNKNNNIKFLKIKNIFDNICLSEILSKNKENIKLLNVSDCFSKLNISKLNNLKILKNAISFIISPNNNTTIIKNRCFIGSNYSWSICDSNHNENNLYKILIDGLKWIHKLINDGDKWSLNYTEIHNIPKELFPNMCNKEDFPWTKEKNKVALKIKEITLLYNCGIKERNNLINNNIFSFDLKNNLIPYSSKLFNILNVSNIEKSKKNKIISNMILMNNTNTNTNY